MRCRSTPRNESNRNQAESSRGTAKGALRGLVVEGDSSPRSLPRGRRLGSNPCRLSLLAPQNSCSLQGLHGIFSCLIGSPPREVAGKRLVCLLCSHLFQTLQTPDHASG